MVDLINVEDVDTMEEANEVVSDFIEMCEEAGGKANERKELSPVCLGEHGTIRLVPQGMRDEAPESFSAQVNAFDTDIAGRVSDVDIIEKSISLSKGADKRILAKSTTETEGVINKESTVRMGF